MDDSIGASPPSGASDSGQPGNPWDTRLNDVPKKMPMGEKLLNIFIEPSSVFKNIYYHNDWLTPFIFGAVLSIGAAFLNMQYSAEAQNAFRELMKAPSMPEAASAISQYIQILFAPAGLLFGWLVSAAILFMLGNFMLDRVDFVKLFSIAAFASLPTLFTNLISGIYKMGQTPVISSYEDYIDAMMPWTLSLGRIIQGDGLFFKMITVIDIFAIWSYWLVVVGLTFGLRNKPKNSLIVTIVYLVITLSFAVGMLALSDKLRPPGL